MTETPHKQTWFYIHFFLERETTLEKPTLKIQAYLVTSTDKFESRDFFLLQTTILRVFLHSFIHSALNT